MCFICEFVFVNKHNAFLGKLKKQTNKKHFDGFNPQWGGGGVSVRIHFSHIFFTFNVKKICLNIEKERYNKGKKKT